MSELNLETVMLIEEFINEAKAMKADRDRLAAELADCQAANHAVAVCRNHTKDITSFDGCLVCDRDRLAARVRELEETLKRLNWAVSTYIADQSNERELAIYLAKAREMERARDPR